MKKTIMQCDCCGKTFFSEYWSGGYIDHYVNFARNFQTMIHQDEEDIFLEICEKGNELRNKEDIECRLNCFKQYCERNKATKKFEKIKALVKARLKKQKALDEIHDKIVDMVHDLTEEEKEYIGLEYQSFCSKRLNAESEVQGE